MKQHWTLDPDVVFLNHGSFGATPRAVLEAQSRYRTELEREPVRFMVRELEPRLDRVRERLAEFLGCSASSLAFVPNATAGINSVLRSLEINEGDELLTTTHEYNATRNVLDFVAERAGAKVVAVDIPLPIASPDEITDRVLAATSPRTTLAVIDHITSPTAVVFPIHDIVRALAARGIDTLVDGAHGPGMVPLALDELGAAWYTGNLHKWVCAPKGAAFLHAREDRRTSTRPWAISHGANARRSDRSRFLLEFDWTGTFDPTAWLAVEDALAFMPGLVNGGWEEIRRTNRQLAADARRMICDALGLTPPVPDALHGSMAVIPLPPGDPGFVPPPLAGDPLQDRLFHEHSIEVPVMPWPGSGRRLLRISAQLYNDMSDYERLSSALARLL